MRGQYRAHQQPQQQHHYHQQQSQYHHQHYQLLAGQQTDYGRVSAGHGRHVHSHSRHSHSHSHSHGRDDWKEGSHHHDSLPAFAMATGGESPYDSVLQLPQHGGFVMGTDLRTTAPTSGAGGWYHEQPEVPIQPVMTSAPSAPQPETTVPRDSGEKVKLLVTYPVRLGHYQVLLFFLAVMRSFWAFS